MLKNFRVKSIPTIFGELEFNTECSGFSSDNCIIPKLEYGKTYYTNVEGSDYNVIRVDCIMFTKGFPMLVFHTPDGKVHARPARRMDTFYPIFESAEDFAHYCLTGNIRYNFQNINAKEEIFGDFYKKQSNYDTWMGVTLINTFYWSDSSKKVESCPTAIKYAWVDKDGGHLVLQDPNIGAECYMTKEECFKHNFNINTGDFCEDKPKTKVYKVSVTLEITATTKAEAVKAAEEKIAYLQE